MLRATQLEHLPQRSITQRMRFWQQATHAEAHRFRLPEAHGEGLGREALAARDGWATRVHRRIRLGRRNQSAA